MAYSPLHFELKRIDITDGDFAKKCGKHRTEIWAYRHRTRMPNGETALAIVEALRELGSKLTLEDVLCKRPHKKAA